jgi:hypothetical protein
MHRFFGAASWQEFCNFLYIFHRNTALNFCWNLQKTENFDRIQKNFLSFFVDRIKPRAKPEKTSTFRQCRKFYTNNIFPGGNVITTKIASFHENSSFLLSFLMFCKTAFLTETLEWNKKMFKNTSSKTLNGLNCQVFCLKFFCKFFIVNLKNL